MQQVHYANVGIYVFVFLALAMAIQEITMRFTDFANSVHLRLFATATAAIILLLVRLAWMAMSSKKKCNHDKTQAVRVDGLRERHNTSSDAVAAARIRKYPVKFMTQRELDVLPKGENLGMANLMAFPLGTLFICNSHHAVPNIVVVGQVVAGKDLLADQWGSGLSIPERGINRYRVVIE